ncbi:hypothetical protein KFL_001740070 [Klebsormidium nitens]|uniref:Uncharacterized protein n=1 Tax=Klebsormidium nitens TaxID=105231 RepID=A0A1Y1I7G2_KLENI|nr:hypothetical protein KFL_001740070 [Klebsormidium nitens]|eukprot:GAQ84048.1 hypothetical protein KFL_001740070 [Klebsormidium nitens]
MPNEGFQPVGSRLRAIRKRDRQDDLEPPSFSLGIGEVAEMPSFDLGIDSDGEPNGSEGLGLRDSKGLQKSSAVEDKSLRNLRGPQKGADGMAGRGLGQGQRGGSERHDELQDGKVRPRESEERAQFDRRASYAAGRRLTPDRTPSEAAAKSRNRLQKVSSGASEREVQAAAPSPRVAQSPDKPGGAFADSDEEDQALLSIDFRSAGKRRASNGLTPIRKQVSEAGQGLGLGGWRGKGAARESVDRVPVSDAAAAQTPREAELRRAGNLTTELEPRSGKVPSRVDTEPAQGSEQQHPDAGRCQSSAKLPSDGVRTPPSGLMQKRNGLEMGSLGERKRVNSSGVSDGLEVLLKRSSGVALGASLEERLGEKGARKEESKFGGRDFVPDSEDDEIEDVSSPEAKKVPVGPVSGKRRVTLGSAHLRQDQPRANHTTPRGQTITTPIGPEARVLRTPLDGEKQEPLSRQMQNSKGDELGMDKWPGDAELGVKSAKKLSGEGSGGSASGRKSSLLSGLRKRKSDENGGGWSEWPANAFGGLGVDESGRSGKENGIGTGEGRRNQNGNGTQFGSEEDGMGARRPVPPDLENGRKGGLVDNPAAKVKGSSPSWNVREAKKGKRWSGFGAAEETSAGFAGFGTTSERTYPAFGAAAGGFGTGSERTYPPFGATTGSDNPGFEKGFERSYPPFGGLRREGPSGRERDGFAEDAEGLGGFGEGFKGFGGASRGVSSAGGDERAERDRGSRRPWSPPPPDFGSLEDDEDTWGGGATGSGIGSRAERNAEWGGGTEAGNGTERADGTESAHGMAAAENGTDWERRPNWGEDLDANGLDADGLGQGGTREGGPGADGSGASGTGAAEQEAVVRLLRERLPHYKPLDMLMREGGFDNEPIFIDYRNQFADIPAGGGGTSRSYGGKKSSSGRRPAKPAGPVHTGGSQEKGHWTTIGGKKVYVNKTGKTLEGRAAYRSHLKDSGAQPKKKRKKARRKGASKKR